MNLIHLLRVDVDADTTINYTSDIFFKHLFFLISLFYIFCVQKKIFLIKFVCDRETNTQKKLLYLYFTSCSYILGNGDKKIRRI